MKNAAATIEANKNLVSIREILESVTKQNKAVAALNFYNAETLRAHINAANECDSALILQTTESTINYLGIDLIVAMAQSAAREISQSVALHLDHGASFELAKRCISAGYSSVMIDGSKLPFDENINLTKKVVELAHANGVSVEGELGHVAQNSDNQDISRFFTRPEDAERFVTETGVDALAVAIGTAHGFYKGEVKIDFNRLNEIAKAVRETALVLHGGSGIPAELMQKAIRCGIRKINFGTDLKNAFTLAVKKTLIETDEIDLRKTFAPAIKAVQAVSIQKIRICNLI